MTQTCATCGIVYDDVYHDTGCPHPWFPSATITGICRCPHEHPKDQRGTSERFRLDMELLREAFRLDQTP